MGFKSRTVQAGGKQGQIAKEQKRSFVGSGELFPLETSRLDSYWSYLSM